MISVCMATYNGEKYIKSQLESILKQLSVNDEVIISDDASTDNTLGCVEEINDSRIRVIQNRNEHGYTGNFYNALKCAKGDYIFLADQDDVWLDNKVEIMLNYLKKSDYVVSDAVGVDANLNTLYESHFKKYNVKEGFYNSLLKCRYLGCCMAFRRNVLESLFPVPSYSNNYPHDLWITLIAERYFKTIRINQPLILYRRHGTNVSDGGDNKRTKRSLIKRILSRVFYLWYVLKQRRIFRKRLSK